MNTSKILFVSHTFPPTVGGVETHNFELSRHLAEIAEIKIIANTRGRKFLPLFAPYALLKSLWLLPQYDVVLLGSGMLAINGWFVKLFSKKPVVCVTHGLDINYNSASLGVWYEKFLISLYQNLWTKVFLPKLDKYIAVGNETIEIGVRHGLQREKFVFIPNGTDTEKNVVSATKEDISRIIGIETNDKNVLLTTGRLAKRKGVAWFIRNVLPQLEDRFIYIVGGNGPDKENIADAITQTGTENRVFLLGYVSDENRNLLWNSADLFLQPNIKIAGDLEGFGISVIEAGSCRLPVLASDLEGLKDAIKDGKNGFLVEHENAQAYVNKINELFADSSPREKYGEQVRQFVKDQYEWKNIATLYLAEIQKVVNKN